MTEEWQWMLVLASSRKLGGRCVAGVNTGNEWVRPISKEKHGTLHADHCGGSFPNLLDVVRFRVAGKAGTRAHPEDVLLDESSWEVRGRKTPRDIASRLARLAVPGPSLLGDQAAFVTKDSVERRGVHASLELVEPPEVVFIRRGGKTRVEFELSGCPYDLPLTDCNVAPTLGEGNGEWSYDELRLGRARRLFLTASLGERLEDRHWKLVAAVIPVP
jgi:hypothetical protein